MADEPTAWEDINPTTALARQQGPRSLSSALQPASNETFRNELTACLALVAPVGMNEEAKRDWLAVAWATLSHLPPDVLMAGCKAARQTCDHPSKIVPAIIAETREMMSWKQGAARGSYCDEVPQLNKPDYVKPEEAAKILQEFGLEPKRASR